MVSDGPSGGSRPREGSPWRRPPTSMLSAVIRADHRYPALLLADQPVHERIVRPGPLVLGSAPLNPPTPTTDTDRTVSRRSEPSSCTTLTGEQPDPWDLLQPQDVISRHRG